MSDTEMDSDTEVDEEVVEEKKEPVDRDENALIKRLEDPAYVPTDEEIQRLGAYPVDYTRVILAFYQRLKRLKEMKYPVIDENGQRVTIDSMITNANGTPGFTTYKLWCSYQDAKGQPENKHFSLDSVMYGQKEFWHTFTIPTRKTIFVDKPDRLYKIRNPCLVPQFRGPGNVPNRKYAHVDPDAIVEALNDRMKAIVAHGKSSRIRANTLKVTWTMSHFAVRHSGSLSWTAFRASTPLSRSTFGRYSINPFETFLLGLHPRVGANSSIQRNFNDEPDSLSEFRVLSLVSGLASESGDNTNSRNYHDRHLSSLSRQRNEAEAEAEDEDLEPRSKRPRTSGDPDDDMCDVDADE